MNKTTTSIVLEIAVPIKCVPEDFEEICREKYRRSITHDLIRTKLALPENTWVKLNGGFTRDLELLDQEGVLYTRVFRIQTALYRDPITGEESYVSVFPSFIRQYWSSSLPLLEYIGCTTGKGEDILVHIQDPKELLLDEDRYAKIMQQLEKRSPVIMKGLTELMQAAGVVPGMLFAHPTQVSRRFPGFYRLVMQASRYFCQEEGILAKLHTVFRF